MLSERFLMVSGRWQMVSGISQLFSVWCQIISGMCPMMSGTEPLTVCDRRMVSGSCHVGVGWLQEGIRMVPASLWKVIAQGKGYPKR